MTAAVSGFWRERRAYLLEVFLIFNLAFLTCDILLAHAVNRFARSEEWIPFGFSAICGLILLPLTVVSWRKRSLVWGRRVVIGFGVLAVAVGLAGLFLHLESQFLREQTLKHLVYTAPFAAPLAYAGLGSLLVLNRRFYADDGWATAVIFAALGGFFGNFVLALCDHAQNGFYRPVEWTAVGAAALACGFLTVLVFIGGRSRRFLWVVLGLLGVQCVVGAVGFGFHAAANLNGPAASALENFIHGAPAFAPLLFVNISMLAGLGVVDLLVGERRS